MNTKTVKKGDNINTDTVATTLSSFGPNSIFLELLEPFGSGYSKVQNTYLSKIDPQSAASAHTQLIIYSITGLSQQLWQ